MPIDLSKLAIVLGLGTGLLQVFGIAKPEAAAASMRKFPRSLPWGIVLMLLGTGWFVWNMSQESISDFASYKSWLLSLFAAIGILSCFFVQDFLAARGLAVVLLLLAKLMVDTGRPALSQTPWVLVFQGWAYLMVIAGLWLTVSPWRLRDALEWSTASHTRLRIMCGIRLAFGLFIAVLGLTAFRAH
ncbi:MAG: hypothetical protein C5B50_04860 [Verrucomicrobia bacterium]|nr:MAG: hypothetical protein C5B50_04860 [Verrucomicrobiota bacterium]